MNRSLIAGGTLLCLMGAALLLPVVTAWAETGELTRLAVGVVAAACILMAAGTVALWRAWRRRRDHALPSGVRLTLAANILILAFCSLELSDRLVRQEGRLFYWSTFLFLPAMLLFGGLRAARRWAWWIARGVFALGALWFIGFVAVIPFAHLETAGHPVPWYGRVYMAGVSLAFGSILGAAYRSLGHPETRRYFGLLPVNTEETRQSCKTR